MGRIKVILAVTATMAMLLAMMAGPVMANDWNGWDDGCIGVHSGGECLGVGNDHHWNDWDDGRNHWNGWNHWDDDFDFDDCFWWDGELFCEVDW